MNRFQHLIAASFLLGFALVGLGFAALVYFDGYDSVDGAIRGMILRLPLCHGIREGSGDDPCSPLFWWALLLGGIGGVVIVAIASTGMYVFGKEPHIQAEVDGVHAAWSKPEFSGPDGRLRWLAERIKRGR